MKTEKQVIEFSDTGYFSAIFLDYISGNKKVQPFYKYSPELNSFKQAISEVQKQSFNRELLVEVVSQQYANCQLTTSNQQLLINKNTFTVCTGHQLCLFTGPLYFIYKIITTINLSEELKKAYPEYNFVPVYWMASEDHDFEEVSSVNVFGRNMKWVPENGDKVGKRQKAVGKMKTDSIKNVIEELKPILGESENAKALVTLMENAYLKNKNLADATRYLVNELFGEYGLLIIDANDARLKKEFTSILKDDIFNKTNYKHVNSAIKELKDAGYEAQVSPREINVFYMTEEARERIVFESSLPASEAGKFKVQSLGLAFTKEELEKEMEQHPERFSPNVVLRPLYQQKTLPNLAYIGGPSEIAYWLQYKGMFEYHQLSFPVLFPRNSVMQIDAHTQQQMKKMGLATNDLFKVSDVLIKEFLIKNAGDISLKEAEESLKSIYKEIAEKAQKTDPTLKAAVEAELQKQLNALKNIENKLIRAEKQKHEITLNKIKKIKEKLFPNNTLQERNENFMGFYVHQEKNLLTKLKNQLKATEFRFIVLTDKE